MVHETNLSHPANEIIPVRSSLSGLATYLPPSVSCN